MMNAPTHARRRALCLAIAALALSISAISHAQSFPPAWKSTSAYAIGDLTQSGGNWYRAIKAVTGGAGPANDYTDWELNYVRGNTTLMIGTSQTFPTLGNAWTYAINARVADGAYLHFYISSAHGKYSQSLSAPFLLDHASGPRIAILADNVANVSFIFDSTNGFILDTGHSLNTLSGIGIYNLNVNNANDGLKIDQQSTVSSVTGCLISGFFNAVHVTQESSVTLTSTSQLFYFQGSACYSETCSSIILGPSFLINGNNLGSNIALNADLGGVIQAGNGMTIAGCSVGIQSNSEALVTAPGVTVESPTYFGVSAGDRGFVLVAFGSFSGSGIYDLTASQGAFIDAAGSTFTTQHADSFGSYIFS
jgi:hypothetical protein